MCANEKILNLTLILSVMNKQIVIVVTSFHVRKKYENFDNDFTFRGAKQGIKKSHKL